MRETPLVSIIIITMNHEKFIRQACESAIRQIYPNIEIVLLDNKSDDKTLHIAKSTLENCEIPHQIIENEQRFGVAKNLNILVSHASGDYICILSGDDWLTDDSIEQKVKFLQAEQLDFVLTDGYRFIQSENRIVDAYTKREKKKIMKSIPNFFHENVTANHPFNVGVFVKRELLVKYPFDEQIHAEDWDMNLRLTWLGYKVGFLNKKLFYYRILPGSLSKNWDLMEMSFQKITEKYIDYIKNDKQLLKKYKLNALRHQYENILSKTKTDSEKKKILTKWKSEKYKIKYAQPILGIKLLLLKWGF